MFTSIPLSKQPKTQVKLSAHKGNGAGDRVVVKIRGQLDVELMQWLENHAGGAATAQNLAPKLGAVTGESSDGDGGDGAA